MIAWHARSTPTDASREFLEWASLLSSEVFVNLVVYADESGEHVGPGSEVFIVAGWVASREDWAKFCASWRKVLNKFSTDYFHFREWSYASRVVRKKREPKPDFKKNPYKSWDQVRLDEFLIELAEVAASGNKLIVGGYVPANKLREDKLSGFVSIKDGPRELCVRHFFDSVITTINRHRRPWRRQPASFLFEHQDTNKEWKKIVNAEFDISGRKNPQFRDISFGYKEDHLPLQAADMVAYRLRQKLEKTVKLDFSNSTWPELDNILFKTMDEWSKNLTPEEKDAVIRRFFVVPESMTYEQAIQSINSSRRNPA